MKRGDAFPSKYLSKEDIKKPTIGIIEHVMVETVGQGEKQDTKPILYFQNDLKPMVCNATNWDTLEALYGDESDNWFSKSIEIWVDPSVVYGGKREGGLRLRAPATTAAPVHANSGTLAARYAALVARAMELHLVFPVLDPAANDSETTAAGIALKAMIEAAEKQPAF